MRKVLLVIDSSGTDEKTFRYAMELCQSAKAELAVLRINHSGKAHFGKQRKNASAVIDTEINRLTGIAMAAGITCTVTTQDSLSEQQIDSKYHGEVILTIDNTKEAFSLHSEANPDRALPGSLPGPVVRVAANRKIPILDKYRYIFKEVQKMGNMFQKMLSLVNGNQKHKDVNESIQMPDNYPAMADPPATEEDQARLVVVGNESRFSKEMIDYAIEMAQRMDYQIIALNTTPLSCETFKLFSSSSQLCDEFKSHSEQGAQRFAEIAARHDIPFVHTIKFLELDDALEEVQKEFGEIGFIVSEPENQQGDYAQAENEDRQAAELCVYSFR